MYRDSRSVLVIAVGFVLFRYKSLLVHSTGNDLDWNIFNGTLGSRRGILCCTVGMVSGVGDGGGKSFNGTLVCVHVGASGGGTGAGLLVITLESTDGCCWR